MTSHSSDPSSTHAHAGSPTHQSDEGTHSRSFDSSTSGSDQSAMQEQLGEHHTPGPPQDVSQDDASAQPRNVPQTSNFVAVESWLGDASPVFASSFSSDSAFDGSQHTYAQAEQQQHLDDVPYTGFEALSRVSLIVKLQVSLATQRKSSCFSKWRQSFLRGIMEREDQAGRREDGGEDVPEKKIVGDPQ